MRARREFELGKEKRDQMIASIKNYFLTERGEDLGDLAAALILDFFIEQIAPEFYNQGIYDCYRYILERSEDMLGLQK